MVVERKLGFFQIIGKKDIDPIILRELAAEFVGTFFLIFIGCGGVAGAVLQKSGAEMGSAATLQIAFAFGIGIAGAVHLFSDISGAHFNPAVSLAIFFSGQLSLFKTVIFTIAQLAGGMLGGGTLRVLLGVCPGSVQLSTSYVYTINETSGFFIELLGTLFLVLTVLATTNSNRNHQPGYLQPLSIGFAIFCLHMFMVPTTGCGLNPVRSLVTNAIENNIQSYFFLYIFGPLLASPIGGLLHTFVFNPHFTATSADKVDSASQVKCNIATPESANDPQIVYC